MPRGSGRRRSSTGRPRLRRSGLSVTYSSSFRFCIRCNSGSRSPTDGEPIDGRGISHVQGRLVRHVHQASSSVPFTSAGAVQRVHQHSGTRRHADSRESAGRNTCSEVQLSGVAVSRQLSLSAVTGRRAWTRPPLASRRKLRPDGVRYQASREGGRKLEVTWAGSWPIPASASA